MLELAAIGSSCIRLHHFVLLFLCSLVALLPLFPKRRMIFQIEAKQQPKSLDSVTRPPLNPTFLSCFFLQSSPILDHPTQSTHPMGPPQPELLSKPRARTISERSPSSPTWDPPSPASPPSPSPLARKGKSKATAPLRPAIKSQSVGNASRVSFAPVPERRAERPQEEDDDRDQHQEKAGQTSSQSRQTLETLQFGDQWRQAACRLGRP
ncbi:hypothetical protein C8R47DRAFT_757980 [Mycena vitilis]|nr:hypothetical protein C8R47DRAFT_757980 [Mycena vitilis]